MSYSIPTVEPIQHEAGTDLIFNRDFADFPADTWTLSYALRNATAAPIDITATADTNGLTHKVNETAATTQTWTAGEYYMVGYVVETSGTDRHRVYAATIEILPYVAGEQAYEWRSWARQCRDAIREAILSSAGSDVVSYSINGRSFTKGKVEVMQALDRFEAKVRWEEIRAKKRQQKILVRFT